MNIDWITIRVIWQIVSGFIIAVLLICLLGVVISIIFADNSPVSTTNINSEYYFTRQTRGFPNIETIEEINVYKKKEWLPDKKIVSISMYAYQVEFVDVDLQANRFKMYINGKIKLDTLMTSDNFLQIHLDDW